LDGAFLVRGVAEREPREKRGLVFRKEIKTLGNPTVASKV
jgi:hypothetical protein